VELLSAEPQSKIVIDQVLLVNQDGQVHIGQPWVKNAVVEATVLEHRKAKKVIVYKMRPKKKTRRKYGHRQPLTRIMINEIKLGEAIAA
jgi:large subunit ribosomal protein L21